MPQSIAHVTSYSSSKFFIDDLSFSLNTNPTCKTPRPVFSCLQMVTNKDEALHSHRTAICSTFFPPINFIFLFGFLGVSTEGGLQSERQSTAKAHLLEVSEEHGFSSLLVPPSSPHQQHYPEHVLVSLPTHFFHSVVLCWSHLSAVTKDHLLLLHSITHKSVSSDKKAHW